jgi:hypothetical protein
MKPLVLCFSLAVVALSGCSKEAPKKVSDEPKKATPVPTDMVFNDFVPSTGAQTIVGVKGGDGGSLEAGAEVAAAGEAPASPEGALRLVEPGTEPRAARKYTFVVGKVDNRLVTVRQSMSREGGGPAQAEAFAVTASFVPKVVKATTAKFDLKVLKLDMPDLPAPQKAQAQAQLATLTGLSGTFDVSSRGDIGEIDFKSDERMAGPGAEMVVQNVQQAFELLVPPLPVEAIGVGAKWERVVERKERGQQSTTKHVFTLVEVNAEGGVVTADVELGVPKHPIQARGLPPGATEEVKGKGTYSYTFRFDRLATKAAGEMAITRRIEIEGAGGGPKQGMAEIIKLKSQLEPAPAK